MIKVENIYKQFGKREVLKGVGFDIPKNQITSLIGPNGAGKSTLLSIISRLIEKDKGSVSLDGENLFKIKNKELAKHLSFLKQANHLDLRLTVEELVAFGRFPYSKGKLTQIDHEKIQEAITFCSLEDFKDCYLDELSGGQRQRAFLAMVIAQDTEYILLDEPLNNLDMKLSVQVMKTLKRLVEEKRKTVIIVIHEINFASNYSDYIIALKNGKVLKKGPTEEVISAENLKEIFDLNFEVIERNGQRICNYFNL
ncbi:ATP-binding cassette domain-containing protein [Weeksella virosa]|uniref:iron ABC transporter ATP-binding protein n=1 Tax=Weeksella virosa TaxID=1014 RepID=UPI000DFE971D|nr:ATP-binding cassette domain-containing protein [Weeksella virosa]MDK7674298.1 ATP-binding cassette domain-containing protein [Weeksella virosa]SUP54051.1 Probable siderophore transport system ATP-binding protein YusV [Weeksella virosa]